jgi:hypothetical protein
VEGKEIARRVGARRCAKRERSSRRVFQSIVGEPVGGVYGRARSEDARLVGAIALLSAWRTVFATVAVVGFALTSSGFHMRLADRNG